MSKNIVRLAGQMKDEPEIFQAIWKHLKSDGLPDQAANQLTAEMITHGDDIDTSIERYEYYYDLYKEKGFNEHAAQALAVEALEGRESPEPSKRFAMLRTDEESCM